MGLSSLGRAESNVLASVDAVLRALHRIARRRWQPEPPDVPASDFAQGTAHLAAHAEALLGPAPSCASARLHPVRPWCACALRLADRLPADLRDA